MTNQEIISWLLEGDFSVQYQANRDLLKINKPELQQKIAQEGWGKELLSKRQQNGHWGKGFYQPKWTCSHYTLLDLKNLNIAPVNQSIKEIVEKIFLFCKSPDGGIGPISTYKRSDVCINGMALNYACYFGVEEEWLRTVIDFLLAQKMQDGGFNCRSNTSGASHSSLHTTLSVLEGILEYDKQGFKYRLNELLAAKERGEEFILMHRLFRSDKTGEIINPNFLKLYYPGRWYYDILKALDYFQLANSKYDLRMDDAIRVLTNKRTAEGLWKLPPKHPGQTHFEMEQAGKPSRWNTLRALRVLEHFNVA